MDKQIWELFHSLWGKAADNKSNYDKEQWKQLQALLHQVLKCANV